MEELMGELMVAGNNRTRMNVSLTAKGATQWDITAEYDLPEEAAKNLGEAIDKVRQIIKEKGLTEAGTV